MEVIVEDTNILIDLINTGLSGYVAQLDITFITTSLVVLEVKDPQQKAHVNSLLENGLLTPVEIEGDDYLDVILTHKDYSSHCNLSQADISLMLLAEKRKCRLLTSDQQLRRHAQQRGVTVNGFLWLTDLLVQMNIVSRKDMIVHLRSLIETNNRAPQKEIFDRIAEYDSMK